MASTRPVLPFMSVTFYLSWPFRGSTCMAMRRSSWYFTSVPPNGGLPTNVRQLGGSTAKVGDPTDRSAPRPLQSSSTRKANTAVMHMQLKKLTLNLDSYASYHGYQKEWAWRRDVENNGRWYQKLNLIDFLQNTGNSFRIGPMLGRET